MSATNKLPPEPEREIVNALVESLAFWNNTVFAALVNDVPFMEIAAPFSVIPLLGVVRLISGDEILALVLGETLNILPANVFELPVHELVADN